MGVRSLRLNDIIKPGARVLAWMVAYAAWTHTRFGADVNGSTPYQKSMGQAYRGVVVPFGTMVMLKTDRQNTRHRSKL
eukprot:4809666-Amphidinium_carterae.1